MVFKLWYSVPNRAMRSVMPPTAATCYFLRFVYLLLTHGYDASCWMAYVAVVTGGMAGLLVGNHVSEGSAVSAEFVALSVSWLLLLAALALGEVPAAATVAACVLCVTSMALFPAAMRRRRAVLEAGLAAAVVAPAGAAAAVDLTDVSPAMSPNEATVETYSR
jgi:hypothetical protein